MKSSQNIQRLGHTKFTSCSSDCVLKTLERASDLKMFISFPFLFICHFWWAFRKILCGKYISYIFHVQHSAINESTFLVIVYRVLPFCKQGNCIKTGMNIGLKFRILKIHKSYLPNRERDVQNLFPKEGRGY
jgi:hypothetical protein